MSTLDETRAIDLGLNSVKEKDEPGVLRSIDFLTELGTKYINRKLEPDAKRTIARIKSIGEAAARQKMEVGAFLALQSLERMAKVASGKKMEDTGMSIMYSLYAIGKVAAEEDMEVAVRVAASYLGSIGNAAALQKMSRESLVAPLSLGAIGVAVSRHYQRFEIENSGCFPETIGGPLIKPPEDGEVAICTSEIYGLAGLMFEKKNYEGPPENSILQTEKSPENPEPLNFENAIIQAAHSLDSLIIEADTRYLMAYVIMGKIELDSSREPETLNEGEKLEGVERE